MSKQTVQKILKALRWVPLVLCFLYVVIVLLRIPAVTEKEKTQKTVARIEAQKITIDDVLQRSLPLMPKASGNDSDLLGIDANNNAIRDDLELALATTSAGVRAAKLQYVRTLQSYLTDVFNKETWEAVAVQESRAYQCLGQTFRKIGVNENDLFPLMETQVAYLKGLVFNTKARKDQYKKAMHFITGFVLENSNVCDVDPAMLPH